MMSTQRAEAVRGAQARGAVAAQRSVPRTEASQRTFLGVAALLFAAGTATTIYQCVSMSAMGGMTMPGGWTMSMAWMRMPGAFLVMWLAMMLAMMLPSLLPALQRYRAGVGRTGLTLLVGLGYFAVSTALGAAIFPLGAALAALQMHWPLLAHAAPAAAGLIVVAAGFAQFTAWKAHQLACCRDAPGRCAAYGTTALSAWRSGLRLGVHCSCCCIPQMAVLLAIGVMNLRAMAVVSAAIAAERLLAAGPRLARGAGAVAVCVGLLVVAHAAGLG